MDPIIITFGLLAAAILWANQRQFDRVGDPERRGDGLAAVVLCAALFLYLEARDRARDDQAASAAIPAKPNASATRT